MIRKGNVSISATILIILFQLTAAGCGTPDIPSKWLDSAVIVDGNTNEWDTTHSYYDNEHHVVIGAMNDTDKLYIYLSSTDRKMYTHLIFSGCTVWFDLNGGKEKIFGVHFPVGMLGRGEEMPRPGTEIPSEDLFVKKLDGLQGIIEIIDTARGERAIIKTEDAKRKGIEARIAMQQGVFVYEMQVPLDRIFLGRDIRGSGSTGIIGIGFETEKMKKMAMQPGGDHVPIGGGMPPGGGGMPPGGFGGGPGKGMGGGFGGMPGGGQPPEDFELWAKVALAIH